METQRWSGTHFIPPPPAPNRLHVVLIRHAVTKLTPRYLCRIPELETAQVVEAGGVHEEGPDLADDGAGEARDEVAFGFGRGGRRDAEPEILRVAATAFDELANLVEVVGDGLGVGVGGGRHGSG
jgi:hypothetical protein